MTADYDWPARLEQILAEERARKVRRLAIRQEFARRRRYGLAQRQHRKLARIPQDPR